MLETTNHSSAESDAGVRRNLETSQGQNKIKVLIVQRAQTNICQRHSGFIRGEIYMLSNDLLKITLILSKKVKESCLSAETIYISSQELQ